MNNVTELKHPSGTKADGVVSGREDSKAVISANRSMEIFFGVVGPVGAGGSRVMESLRRACESSGYECHTIKASELIRDWGIEQKQQVPAVTPKRLDSVERLQDLGDSMRSSDLAEVARAALRKIAQCRATATKQKYVEGQVVLPDAVKRAYLIDSIRHPAEINLLRRTYASAFALIGVVCEEAERKKRILGKYFTVPEQQDPKIGVRVDAFMARDSDDRSKKHGQHVADAFFAADFFVDNTRNDSDDKKHFLDEPLSRLVSIISHDRVIRPTIEETAMHHAHSARVRSACMSRQVGAALADTDGTIISTGANEVPRAGGGVYGENFLSNKTVEDHRCAFRDKKYCSNNEQQNEMINDLILSIPPLKEIVDNAVLSKIVLGTELGKLTENNSRKDDLVAELIAAIPALSDVVNKEVLSAKIRSTRLGQLIEFSRAVHAEMDALLSAGREGTSTVGTRLFVTTFPCHYCARHIVSAGVYEVQYIEPYPKSLALKLHDDAIEVDPGEWVSPGFHAARDPEQTDKADGGKKKVGKVLFHPFVGVAPRLYTRAFEETWQLKNKISGVYDPKPPEWGDEWSPFTAAYPELEAALTRRL